MKNSTCLMAGFFFLVVAMCLISTQGTAGEKTCQMQGEITAIESAYNTVVVEVPMGKGTFTVAGPLSSEAILEKEGQRVGLTNFVVGDDVTVKWRTTDKGHIIEMLTTK